MSSHNCIPSLYVPGADACARAFMDIDNVLLAAHVNLDGDALGSLVACGYILRQLDKNFIIYSSTGVPDYLDFLRLPCNIITNLDMLTFNPDSAIYLDCSEAKRLGHALEQKCHDWPVINIDHHYVEAGLGTMANFIMEEAAATSQLVAYIALSLGLPLKGALADSISLGLMTDTGGFCHGNTSADVFDLCALLVREGCDFVNLRIALQNNWSIGRLRLWGEALINVEFFFDNKIAICTINRELLRKSHCRTEDLEGLVECFKKVSSVEVSAMIREEQDELCKFSLRSTGSVDVRAMAALLGGGGHYNAAGGTVSLPIAEASDKLLTAIIQILKEQGKGV